MSDNFAHDQVSLISPFVGGAAVTPDDNTDLATIPRALWIGQIGDGTLRVTTTDGSTINLLVLTRGRLDIRARRVHDTGTGVTDIVALW